MELKEVELKEVGVEGGGVEWVGGGGGGGCEGGGSRGRRPSGRRFVRRVPGSVPVPPPAMTAVVPATFLLADTTSRCLRSTIGCFAWATPVPRSPHGVRHDPDDRDARQDGDGYRRDAFPHTLPSQFVACPRLPGRWRIRLSWSPYGKLSTRCRLAWWRSPGSQRMAWGTVPSPPHWLSAIPPSGRSPPFATAPHRPARSPTRSSGTSGRAR